MQSLALFHRELHALLINDEVKAVDFLYQWTDLQSTHHVCEKQLLQDLIKMLMFILYFLERKALDSEFTWDFVKEINLINCRKGSFFQWYVWMNATFLISVQNDKLLAKPSPLAIDFDYLKSCHMSDYLDIELNELFVNLLLNCKLMIWQFYQGFLINFLQITFNLYLCFIRALWG